MTERSQRKHETTGRREREGVKRGKRGGDCSTSVINDEEAEGK